MDNLISSGEKPSLVAPSGGVVSGGVYKIGSMVVVAAADADAGANFVGHRHGHFTVDKATSEAWTQGAALYWDNTNSVFTTTSTSNTIAGYAAAAAGSADTTGEIILSGSSGL